MPIIFWEGQILFRNSQLAMDLACCCGEGESCCCTRLSTANPPFDLSGRVVGSCQIAQTEFTLTVVVQEGVCRRWAGSFEASGTNCEGFVDVDITCLTAPGEDSGCEDYYLLVTFHNSDCGADQAQTNVYPVAGCRCDPDFFAEYCGFSLQNSGFGVNCDCCEDFCIEIYEP